MPYDYEAHPTDRTIAQHEETTERFPVRVFRVGDYSDTIAICPDRTAAQFVIDALASYEKTCKIH